MRAAFARSLYGLATTILVLLAGCQPAARPVPAGTKGPAPPPLPGGSAGVAAAPAAAPAGGLPPELIAKIDTLIQCHKDYIAAAEKVQDPQAAKERVNDFSQLAQRGGAAYEEVMIAYGKLPAEQKARFEAYMNEHVLAINNLRRQHLERREGLLQSQ